MPTPHLKELFLQEYTNQKLVSQDPHLLTLIENTVLQTQPEIGIFKFEAAEKGTLKSFMKNHELNEEQILFIFKEILLAVIWMHDSLRCFALF